MLRTLVKHYFRNHYLEYNLRSKMRLKFVRFQGQFELLSLCMTGFVFVSCHVLAGSYRHSPMPAYCFVFSIQTLYHSSFLLELKVSWRQALSIYMFERSMTCSCTRWKYELHGIGINLQCTWKEKWKCFISSQAYG